MLKPITNIKEYVQKYIELSKKIDESSSRDDMIIFDHLTRCLSELRLEYPEFEQERVKDFNN